MNRRLHLLAVAFAAGLSTLATSAWADSYPSKPVRMIVGFPPGGPNDIVARVVSEKLEGWLGQPVIVDNRPGAGGNIGTEITARAEPDGYTLLMGSTGPQAINPAVYPRLSFDVLRDLAPVSLVAQVPSVLVVNPQVPARTVSELISFGKQQPGGLRYGSGGYGTTLHLSGELFKSLAGIEMLHVPYKGTAPAISDLAGGQTHVMFAALPSVMPLVRAGKLRVIAVTTRERSQALPDVPTIAESGLPGYEMAPWFGVFATAGTPKPVINRLSQAIHKVVAMPAVKEALEKQGAEPITNNPEEFSALLRTEIAKWSKIVKEANITIN